MIGHGRSDNHSVFVSFCAERMLGKEFSSFVRQSIALSTCCNSSWPSANFFLFFLFVLITLTTYLSSHQLNGRRPLQLPFQLLHGTRVARPNFFNCSEDGTLSICIPNAITFRPPRIDVQTHRLFSTPRFYPEVQPGTGETGKLLRNRLPKGHES